jgi:hypothetical protein
MQTKMKILLKQDNISWRQLDGEYVLFDRTTGNLHFLNRTAFAAWLSCDGVKDTHEIVQELADRFGRTVDDIQTSTYRYLDEIVRLQIGKEVSSK